MIFEYYIRRERVLAYPLGYISGRTRNVLLDRLFGPGPSLPRVLWLLLPLTALFGGLITNDAVCILITPIILDELTQHAVFDAEALTALVVGLPMAANIGMYHCTSRCMCLMSLNIPANRCFIYESLDSTVMPCFRCVSATVSMLVTRVPSHVRT